MLVGGEKLLSCNLLERGGGGGGRMGSREASGWMIAPTWPPRGDEGSALPF